jgi:hypothetical protein
MFPCVVVHNKAIFAPVLDPVQERVVEVLVQDKLPLAEAAALGGLVLPVTVATAVLVQLLLSVTVTV